jgi:hypothetical protein
VRIVSAPSHTPRNRQRVLGRAATQAGRCFDVNDLTNCPSLTVMTPDTTPIKWMPPVMDDDFLPDMGIMTPQ